jgi:UDP-N-acetylmuramoyl-tripeptide--D-alanyl-D-alanine ligase
MKELGAESEKSHQAIGRRISEVCPDEVYLVGPEMKAAVEPASNCQGKINIKWFNESSDKNFEAIASDINLHADDNDVILLKGSHSMQLEKLVPLLCGTEGEAR